MAHWSKLGMKYIQFPTYFCTTFSPMARPIIEASAEDPNCIGIAFAQWQKIDNFKPYFEQLMQVVSEVEKAKKNSK